MQVIRILFLVLVFTSCKNNILYNDCYQNCYQLINEKKVSNLIRQGELVGIVYDYLDNSPIDFTQVEIYNKVFNRKFDSITDGKFKLRLDEGEYFIKISSIGHNTIITPAISIKKGYQKNLRFKVTYEV